jgi:hypothetical protein
MTAKRLLGPAVLMTGIVCLATHSAKAALITCEVAVMANGKACTENNQAFDPKKDSGWKATFDTAQVKNFMFDFKSSDPGDNRGDLLLDKVWGMNDDLKPVRIMFEQVKATVPDPGNGKDGNPKKSTFGFRITMKEKVTNDSGQTWTDFEFNLEDKATKQQLADFTDILKNDEQNLDGHPVEAHFHPDDPNFPTFDKPANNVINKMNSFRLTGTFKDDNHTEQWNGPGIHEWEIAGVLRKFDLIETPSIPEPATLVLFIVGTIGTALYAWRYRNQKIV